MMMNGLWDFGVLVREAFILLLLLLLMDPRFSELWRYLASVYYVLAFSYIGVS